MRPYNGIVQVRTIWPWGPATYGTGFLYGNRHVATVGHALFDLDRGGWASWVQIFPARNGSISPLGGFFPLNLSVHGNWFQSRTQGYDIGFIILNDNVPSASIFSMMAANDAALQGMSVTATGYYNNAHPQHTMWRRHGSIRTPLQNVFVSTYSRAGSLSGAPVYDQFGRVVGIHTGHTPSGESVAVRLTWNKIEMFSSTLFW